MQGQGEHSADSSLARNRLLLIALCGGALVLICVVIAGLFRRSAPKFRWENREYANALTLRAGVGVRSTDPGSGLSVVISEAPTTVVKAEVTVPGEPTMSIGGAAGSRFRSKSGRVEIRITAINQDGATFEVLTTAPRWAARSYSKMETVVASLGNSSLALDNGLAITFRGLRRDESGASRAQADVTIKNQPTMQIEGSVGSRFRDKSGDVEIRLASLSNDTATFDVLSGSQ